VPLKLSFDGGDRALGVLSLRRGDGPGHLAVETNALGALDAGSVVAHIAGVELQGALNLDRAQIRQRGGNFGVDADLERAPRLGVQASKRLGEPFA
jgi:hypothetical protein